MIGRLFILIVGVGIASGQTWSSRARIHDYTEFFQELIQETMLELEKREWCNLKLDGYTHTLNEQLYDWHVGGSVTYENGFVVSIQKVDVDAVQQIVIIPQALIRGNLNLHHVQVGFDVVANITHGDSYEIHRSTGSFTHNAIELQLSITKNILTGELTASTTLFSLTGGDRMVYLPASNITEVLSRRYTPSSNFDSVIQWGRGIINPIMIDLVRNKTPFPVICFSC